LKQVSIIILTYDNLDYNIQCVKSIREYTQDGSYEIVIVDNGSTDGTREWLKQQRDIKLVFPDQNAGFPKGCNLGIEIAKKENDILLLNNDIVVTPHWLDNLKKCLYSNETVGAVGPITNYSSNYQSINVPYKSMPDMIEFARTINNSDKNKWEPKSKLIGFCLLIKRNILDIVGLLDERFSPGNFEDDDLCTRITEAGYNLFLCNDCFIHHYGSATFKKQPEKFVDVMAINAQKFKQKWGFDASLTIEIKSEQIPLIVEPRDKKMNILEIGCNGAATLLRLKYLYPNAQVFGIETDKNIARIINKLIINSTKELEDFPLEFDESHFNYIILGDYLQYAKNPLKILKELNKYLKPEGYVITTMPNLIHYSVIRDMLKGNFFYSSNTIVNKNQNNFFTYNDINEMAKECGYKTPYVEYSYNIRNEEDENFLKNICNISGENMKWNFTCYKYITKFQK